MSEPAKFETWGLVEIMGHVRIAGLCTDEPHFGTNLLRIDVPEVTLRDGSVLPAFTTYFGGSSIYRFTPVSEETARKAASQISTQPVELWDLQRAAEKIASTKLLPAAASRQSAGGAEEMFDEDPGDDE